MRRVNQALKGHKRCRVLLGERFKIEVARDHSGGLFLLCRSVYNCKQTKLRLKQLHLLLRHNLREGNR